MPSGASGESVRSAVSRASFGICPVTPAPSKKTAASAVLSLISAVMPLPLNHNAVAVPMFLPLRVTATVVPCCPPCGKTAVSSGCTCACATPRIKRLMKSRIAQRFVSSCIFVFLLLMTLLQLFLSHLARLKRCEGLAWRFVHIKFDREPHT